jgi:hypothetical protein
MANRKLTWASSAFGNVQAAVDTADNIHLVWQNTPPGDGELYYKKSMNGGATWTPNQRITWTSASSESPSLSVDSLGNIHVVWEEYTPAETEVYYKKSTDGGLTWTAGQRLSWTPGYSRCAKIASHWSGGLYVVWGVNNNGNDEVYFRKGTIGGPTWSTGQKVTWTPGNSSLPALAVDFSGNLHLAWIDDTPGNLEVYYQKSTNDGVSWSAAQRVTWTPGYSNCPSLAVDTAGNPYVVWEDDAPGKEEIYYRRSTDGGVSWSTWQRLTWNSGYSYGPAVALDPSGCPHVLWWDDTPGNFEIHYKRGN